MLKIDGSYGEGGGQILRTTLTLAAITGKSVQVQHIRAHRSKPGLRPQHLTAVRAAAAICNAKLEGDQLHSQSLRFVPQTPVQPGTYRFNVVDAAPHGSAGSVTLIMQTLLLPLALAPGPSEVTLYGGTHVPMSPPARYIETIYLPTLFEMGVKAQFAHRQWGLMPQGQGCLEVSIAGKAALRPIDLSERGAPQHVHGVAFASKLPSHIPQRMSDRARAVLQQAGLPRVHITPQHVTAKSTGAGLFLAVQYAHTRAGFNALGRKGLPSEKVADMACRVLLAHHRTGASLDPHLADQLLLPFALTGGESRLSTSHITPHLLANAWVIEQFGIARVHIAGKENDIGDIVVKSSSPENKSHA